ncbi:hypothetical protein [Paraflavitalea sp. CAU 1676]|uniref:DUF6929 family protein n=1 Tax=Paraflavitalea sp. CAU 1676 TaxID=3032598 RepID=UPI0023DA1326|nr:hypothetical protein [Paraflavitalea sp. CAU 1676]MDF2192656.1 hypothetical protein [Paraflavitalea sp. CAU 1676]
MKLTLTDFKILSTFPTGSSIEFHDQKVFVVGRDAREVLIMNKRWKELERIPLVDNSAIPIEQKIQSDLEATTVVLVNSIPRMLILGSGSREHYHNKAILLDLDSYLKDEFDMTVFYDRVKAAGITDLNIGSAATLDEGHIIMANRGSTKNPDNHLIITRNTFWKHQTDAELEVLPIKFPGKDEKLKQAGITGLTYSAVNDWLVFTAATNENGPVGVPGDSYLGVIENASRKIGRKDMKVNEIIPLGEAEKSLKGYKIDALCMQSEKNARVKLQFVADNNDGVSCLFKVRIK